MFHVEMAGVSTPKSAEGEPNQQDDSAATKPLLRTSFYLSLIGCHELKFHRILGCSRRALQSLLSSFGPGIAGFRTQGDHTFCPWRTHRYLE